MLERWERAAEGWGRRAGDIRRFGMPVSAALIEQLDLQPGQRVLELAAGPGDTGFLAAELIRPGGVLVSSDAAEAMLEVARTRAAELGVDNVEFKRLELEWIDLPTASVDAILCRWGLMLSLDPAAALHEARRVLRPGGRIALAVWDEPGFNPWATVPTKALTSLGHAEPPDPGAPGMFALASAQRLRDLLEGAGFGEVEVSAVEVQRKDASVEAYIEETLDMSLAFSELFERLSESERTAVIEAIGAGAAPFVGSGGEVVFPGRSLVVGASG
jgi:ubiquinone/menaquinone biosynthesis C-methylase UbiE